MSKLIIAILPELVKGRGICSRIYRQDKTYLDYKTPTHYLKTLYDDQGKSKKKIDAKTKATYQIKRNLPYVIDANQVFFAFTVRKSSFDKQTRGFVNVAFVEKIVASQIVLISGEEISTLNKEDALIANRNLARALMLEEILKLRIDMTNTIKFVTGRIRTDLDSFK